MILLVNVMARGVPQVLRVQEISPLFSFPSNLCLNSERAASKKQVFYMVVY